MLHRCCGVRAGEQPVHLWIVRLDLDAFSQDRFGSLCFAMIETTVRQVYKKRHMLIVLCNSLLMILPGCLEVTG
jgi:hypothetical protein